MPKNLDFSDLLHKTVKVQSKTYAANGATTLADKITGIAVTLQPQAGGKVELYGKPSIPCSHYAAAQAQLDIDLGDVLVDGTKTYDIVHFNWVESALGDYFEIYLDESREA
jgi:hypothetical protein